MISFPKRLVYRRVSFIFGAVRFLKAHIALFIVALIYGGNYLIAKEVMAGEFLEPLGFVFLRIGVALIAFFLLQKLLIRESIQIQDLPRLALCGLFGTTLNMSLFFSGLDFTTPVNASVLMTSTPILVLVAAHFLLHEKIRLMRLLGILAGAFGAVVLITRGFSLEFDTHGWLGDLMVFVNAACYAVYLVIVKPLMRKYHPLTVISYVFLFGFLFMLPVGSPQVISVPWETFTTLTWIGIGYVLLCTTVLAYWLNVYAMKFVSPTVVAIYIYLQPVFATLFSLIWDKDHLTWVKVIAALLIFLGVYLVSIRPSRAPAQIEE